MGLPVVILIGLAALLAGLLAGATLGRRNRVVSGTAVPVAQGVVAEGTAISTSVGRFRGNVHALVLGRRGVRRTPEARYLVSDPSKAEPFWVSQDEVSSITPPPRRRPFEATAGVDSAPVKALGYVSVPPNEERQSAEFDAQLDAIDRYCDEQGWELVEVVRDVEPAAPMSAERRGLIYALDKIGRKEASCIIVSDLGRLSRSAADLGGIIERLERSDGRLVALDIGLDTASPDGYVAAKALASVSSLEGDRARKGLAAAAAGPAAVMEPVERGRAGAQGAHRHDAHVRDDPPGDRRRPQRRGRADAARRRQVATVERPVGGRLPAPAEEAGRMRRRCAPAEPACTARITPCTSWPQASGS